MPTPKLLAFTLQDANGKYYYLDNETIKLSSTIKYLNFSPTDWDKTEITLGRNGEYWGVYRNIITPITFAKDGATILRKIVFEDGVGAYCKYTIYKRNDEYIYDVLSEGEVDFSEFVNTNETAMIKAIENGLQADIEAEKDTEYEIDMTDPSLNSKFVYLDGVKLQGSYKWVIPQTLDVNSNPTWTPVGVLMTMANLDSSVYYQLGSQYTVYYNGFGTQWYFESDYLNSFNINISFNLKIWNSTKPTQSNKNIKLRYKLRIIDEQLNIVSETVIYTSPVVNANTTTDLGLVTITTSNATIDYNQKMMIIADVINNATNTVIPAGALNPCAIQIYDTDGIFEQKHTYKIPTTYVRAIRFFDLFSALVKKIRPSATVASSYLMNQSLIDFNARPYNVWVTSGTALKQFDSKIKCKLSDLIKTAKAVFGLSFGIEGNTAKLEKLRYFLNDTTTIFQTNDINDYKAVIASQYRYAKINAGYKDQDLGEVNGTQEFCSEQVWTTSIKNSENTLDLVSPFRADPYGIELMRSKVFLGNTESDYSGDNDVFMMQCYIPPTSISPFLLRDYIGTVTGFNVAGGTSATATIFNLPLSPHSNLMRNLELIKSGLEDTVNTLKLVSAKKNILPKYKMNPSISGVLINEDQTINLNGIERRFRYLMYEFTAPLPDNIIQLMATNTKYGKIKFVDLRGNVLSGFPIDLKSKANGDEKRTIKLLCSPTDDLTKQSFIS